EISDKLNVTFEQIKFESYEDSKEILKELQAKGVKEVIGGSWIANISESYGIKGYSYYTHYAFSQTIQNALNILTAYRNELKKSTLFKTIIDINKSGIITTDKKFKINVVSPSAETLLKLPREQIIGQKINTIIKSIDTHRKHFNNKSQKNILYKYKQRDMVIDIKPVT